ncbi:MAG: hypothetical protein LZF86_20009 [Nitrospira sp.]|nr:MAG: hypothetical protein LZF86_20009 [Nitrospira sp.]
MEPQSRIRSAPSRFIIEYGRYDQWNPHGHRIDITNFQSAGLRWSLCDEAADGHDYFIIDLGLTSPSLPS